MSQLELCSVYRPRSLKRWLAPTLVLIGGVVLAAAPWQPSGNNSVSLVVFATCIGGAVIAFAVGMYAGNQHTRLIVSANGIELRKAYLKYFGHVWGFHLQTPWDNVEKLYERADHAEPGLVLRMPMTTSGARWLRRFGDARNRPIYNADQLALISEGRFMPLGPFAHLLQNGSLQESLARYAPWLLPR